MRNVVTIGFNTAIKAEKRRIRESVHQNNNRQIASMIPEMTQQSVFLRKKGNGGCEISSRTRGPTAGTTKVVLCLTEDKQLQKKVFRPKSLPNARVTQ